MNPTELAKDLRTKGWSEEEILHALSSMKEAKESKGWGIKFMDQIVYFVALFMTLLGNFVIAVILVPFMLVASPIYLYPVLVVIGVTFGALYNNIIKDILDIDDAPKIMPELFLPAIAIIVVYIMVNLSNYFAALLELQLLTHEPIMMGLFYTMGFMIPYYFTWNKQKQAEQPPPPPSFQHVA